MSRWSDLAPWEGPTDNQGPSMVEVRGLVLHIAQGQWAGIVPWAKNPASGVSMHFAAGRDGQRAQVVDTDIRAWTQADGNGHWLSVECEGFVPQGLTDAQVEFCAQLLARGHLEYGYPLQLADGASGRGLGYHAMGGAAWGGHTGCPGPTIVAQRPAILARAIAITEGGGMSAHSDQIIDAWGAGVPALPGGEVVAPVVWRQRDEAWQARVDQALTDLATAVAAIAAAPADDLAAALDGATVTATLHTS